MVPFLLEPDLHSLPCRQAEQPAEIDLGLGGRGSRAHWLLLVKERGGDLTTLHDSLKKNRAIAALWDFQNLDALVVLALWQHADLHRLPGERGEERAQAELSSSGRSRLRSGDVGLPAARRHPSLHDDARVRSQPLEAAKPALTIRPQDFDVFAREGDLTWTQRVQLDRRFLCHLDLCRCLVRRAQFLFAALRLRRHRLRLLLVGLRLCCHLLATPLRSLSHRRCIGFIFAHGQKKIIPKGFSLVLARSLAPKRFVLCVFGLVILLVILILFVFVLLFVLLVLLVFLLLVFLLLVLLVLLILLVLFLLFLLG
mmetsp:Transcript_99120/g.258973  ORF Transcript_99120/g.258973 Transcript_99120/m.258973 type:complete len:312 (-) Transcript_99120:228-1163(-)